MASKVMKIDIMSREDYKHRTIAIAKGEYKPSKNEPKVWFESMESLRQVLSGQNQKLLRLIRDRHPASLVELQALSGRKKMKPFPDPENPFKLWDCRPDKRKGGWSGPLSKQRTFRLN